MASPDFLIAGAGIIGLSLALELDRRGASVTVLESGEAMRQTSAAAAGMLAVEDPANPSALYPLAQLSASLYPEFLGRLRELSGHPVEFQTHSTLQSCLPEQAIGNPRQIVPELAAHTPPFRLLSELSVEPRALGAALRAAVLASRIVLHEHTPLERMKMTADSVIVHSATVKFEAAALIDCMGTWSPAPVTPRKGQMLAVQAPDDFDLDIVVRTDDVYIVPRTRGPNRGRLIIGATVEDAGFDLTVDPRDILLLNARAIALLPKLARATFAESWAGLRPATADGLPLLGTSAAQPRYVLATGHFRNGILLAPATAVVLAELLLNGSPSLDLSPFSPARFEANARTCGSDR
jgi:glycine oxidase